MEKVETAGSELAVGLKPSEQSLPGEDAIAWRRVQTPLGELKIGAAAEGVMVADWVHTLEAQQTVPSQSPFTMQANRELAELWAEQAAAELTEYFQGRRKRFTVPVTLSGTAFQTAVWRALRDIPFGETRSYQDIATAVGNPRAVRAVGQANRRNPVSVIVPCHRVIGANGSLVGYAGKHVDLKQQLLDLERALQ